MHFPVSVFGRGGLNCTRIIKYETSAHTSATLEEQSDIFQHIHSQRNKQNLVWYTAYVRLGQETCSQATSVLKIHVEQIYMSSLILQAKWSTALLTVVTDDRLMVYILLIEMPIGGPVNLFRNVCTCNTRWTITWWNVYAMACYFISYSIWLMTHNAWNVLLHIMCF